MPENITLTYILIGLNVAASLYGFSHPEFISKTIFNPYLIATRNQYYRFITSGFIHKDYTHLIFNMISFYFFGSVVEQTFRYAFPQMGQVYFVVFFLLGIVIASIPTYLKNKDNPVYNALGASGGVAAIVFASILFEPLRLICFYFVICLPGFLLGALYLIYSYFKGRGTRDNINHDAHLYGALFGLVFCAIMIPASIESFINQLAGWNFFEQFNHFLNFIVVVIP